MAWIACLALGFGHFGSGSERLDRMMTRMKGLMDEMKVRRDWDQELGLGCLYHCMDTT